MTSTSLNLNDMPPEFLIGCPLPDPEMVSEDFTREFNLRKHLRNNFEDYANRILKIRAKDGQIIPLVFNDSQRYLHDRIELQKSLLGRVRALIVKGRQQGCSTYVGARFYHKTTHFQGYRTFILTHEQDATANLFDIVQRYHENNFPQLKPYTGKANAKELVFPRMDSGYRVGTAGTKGKGRSNTVQLFHGSEVAFWPHATEHAAGIGQTVPQVDGTETILESTANGMGNYFHRQWVKSIAGQSEYIPIFIPWYWQREYQKPIPEFFQLDADDLEYMETYNLTKEQMVWRRDKIRDLEDPLLFKQEYPATSDEAFQVTGVDSFIKAEQVVRARKLNEGRSFGAIIAGFDPKRDGEDRDALIYRQGSNAFGLKYNDFKTFPEKVGFCERILRSHNPYVDKMFIDYGGGGYEIAGMLVEKGLGHRVQTVNFGARARNPEVYANKKSEIWGEMRAWLDDEDMPVSIPDDDALQSDLLAPGYKYDSNTRYVIERKAQVKARDLKSPDGADALGLTFAEPVFIRNRVMGGVRHTVQTDYPLYPKRN